MKGGAASGMTVAAFFSVVEVARKLCSCVEEDVFDVGGVNVWTWRA